MVSRRLARLLSLVLAVGLSAPGVAADPSAAPGASPAPSAAPSAPVVLPGGPTTFGTYELVPLLTNETPYAGPATPRTLTGVAVGPDVRELLKDASSSGRSCATAP